jgi:hypothetical protein
VSWLDGDPEVEAEREKFRQSKATEAGNGHDSRTSTGNFTLVRFCDIQLGKEPPYLVRGLIPREGLTVVWGPPKCGKTFWVFDLMMHVALEWKYRGLRVEPGPVVYVACEGERGLAARAEAFRQTHLAESDDPPFYLLTTRLDLAAQVDALSFEVAAQLPDGRCSAIVLDTLNRSIGGSESDDGDMGAYVKAADKLREKFGCAVVIIHHCGVNDKRPRGHTSLTGAADAQIRVTRNGSGQIVAEVEFMKDGPEGTQIVSQLKVVDLGRDDYDEPICSCVICATEGAAPTQPSAKKKLAPAQQRALSLLAEAIAKTGTVPPTCDHIPPNVSCVPEALWRDYCYAGQISESDKPDAKRQAFNRSAKLLISFGHVGKWNDLVWIAR